MYIKNFEASGLPEGGAQKLLPNTQESIDWAVEKVA